MKLKRSWHGYDPKIGACTEKTKNSETSSGHRLEKRHRHQTERAKAPV